MGLRGGILCRTCCLIAAIVRAVVWLRNPPFAWWLATAALGGALAVFLISFLVSVTAWYDTRPLRFAEGYPLLLIFAWSSLLAWKPMRAKVQKSAA